MNISASFYRSSALLVGMGVLLVASTVRAQLAVNVTMNTSALIGKSAAPFYLDFQLNDGSGIGDGNNTVTLSHFNFVTGGAIGSASAFGGVTGNLGSTITLKDTSAFNEFYQAFTPGTSLSFTLSSTTNFAGLVPDLFAFSILDNTLSNLPTLSGGSDAFLVINLTGASTVAKTYAEDGSIAPAAGGPALGLAAPSVTPVPEPATYGLTGAGVLLASIIVRRRARRN